MQINPLQKKKKRAFPSERESANPNTKMYGGEGAAKAATKAECTIHPLQSNRVTRFGSCFEIVQEDVNKKPSFDSLLGIVQGRVCE